MDINSRSSSFRLWQKFFWRFILLFLILYIVPYDLAFGFSEKFEEWRWWHKPIFWIGENLLGWEFDYEKPYVGWDSKFEVCRYIFIFLFGSLLSGLWMILDSYYLKFNYEEKLVVFTQTFLRYRIAIVMLHYGLAKIFMYQFGTIDIDGLETTVGNSSPMGFMWNFLSFSEELQLFSGWLETIGAFLLLFRKTTFFGSFLLVVALSNVVLFDIAFSVSVTLYAIQLLLLTLVLLSNQFKGIYSYFILGKTTTAAKYRGFIDNLKYRKILVTLKSVLFVSLSVLYFKNSSEITERLVPNNYEWFTGLYTIDTFVINGDTLNEIGAEKKWKKLLFNDLIYLNDSFKIEYEDANNERFKYEIDSVKKVIKYRDFENEKASWHEMKYELLRDKTCLFEGIFKKDTLFVETTIKRRKDYNLIAKKGKWLIDLK